MMDYVISTEAIIIQLEEKASDKLVSYLTECLENTEPLMVTSDRLLDSKFLVVKSSLKGLCEKAEELELLKELKNGYVHEFSCEEFNKFKGNDHPETFFTPAEQLILLEDMLNDVSFSKEKFIEAGLRKFGASESIITGCLHSKPQIIESYTPMHNDSKRKEVWKKVKKNPIIFPVNDIHEYYGEDVAYYFAWMASFTWSLLPIALFGVALFLHRPKGITVDDSPFLPAYALVMAFWTIVFIKSWRRKEHELALLWGTSNLEKCDTVRPEFTGVLRTSPITGKKEKYFPAWKRRIQYCISFLLTLPFLLLGVGCMILGLNLNGYIKHPESPIRFARLSSFAEPGHIFAADNPYYGWMIPTIGQSIIINLLNRLYRTVATYCTDIENHRTEFQYDSSLIVKRVMFELFDCFLPLFYIAFYQLDIISLRRELIGLFWGDEIRRLVTETLIPFVMEKIQARRNNKKIEEIKKDKDISSNIQVFENLALEEYEQFDDYLEMVVQFGYVTLFASAFPLCSIITILFLFIEARSDMFKLLFLCRRPIVKRAKGIGVWFKVLTCMMVMSMITNCFLFGFASEQLAAWVPEWYETHEDGDQWIKPGFGRYVVGMVFCAEHVLIMCVVLAHFLISDTPMPVKIELAKREYLNKEELKLLKSKKDKEEKKNEEKHKEEEKKDEDEKN